MTDRGTIRVVLTSGESAAVDAILQAVEVRLTPEQAWMARYVREGRGWQFEEGCPRCSRPIASFARDEPNEITGRLPCQCEDIERMGVGLEVHGLLHIFVETMEAAGATSEPAETKKSPGPLPIERAD